MFYLKNINRILIYEYPRCEQLWVFPMLHSVEMTIMNNINNSIDFLQISENCLIFAECKGECYDFSKNVN